KGTVLSGAKEVTRFELEALDFHQRVRDGYLALALDHPWWQVVDASQSVEAVHEKIWPLVAKLHQLA
ncbi:MAG: hypothetical protein HYS57_02390, partial [Parcubacteria group bacterium]|nr:hypothetical protein [Parcubacteria group bacterium]